ncbi:PIN domain-like family protein, putative isoform 2 [Hibiscus syriacus]|uniref:PIN domain-like family protein, putative isoform 2 n=1 Tax=Hibiscus syriacus TaxID=106335 RepID=A0A6A2WW78_HIBSY|nr:PIN domain-like family protein, putative isoform 2 [Hibiscus syriacus]
MRFKKQKRHRKTVRFFSVCFGFRQPFKVLCDGTFVHHLLQNDLTPAEKALSAPVKLFTTRFNAPPLCCVSADACIEDVIGENNLEHFFVATQDADLRKKLQKVPNVPLIFGLRNALFLEQPSTFQRDFVKSSEEKPLHLTEKEFKALEKRTSIASANVDEEDLVDEEGLGRHNPGLLPHNTRNYSGKERCKG